MAITFLEKYQKIEIKEIEEVINNTRDSDIKAILNKESLSLNDFFRLLSPEAEKHLKPMAEKARLLTQQHFGKTMQFYVPLYLSNECSNSCLYCGFQRNADIDRKTLNLEEIEGEIKYLREIGFQNILLLTGEAPKTAGVDYIVEAIKIARKYFTYISLEIFSATEEDYKKFIAAGASGLTIYQETYHYPTYITLHPQGLKKNFEWRISTADRALKAGFRKIGLGSLLGLYEWRYEAAFLGVHANYLMKQFWKSEISISFPRLRDMGKNFATDYKVKDINLLQMILSLRLFLPWIGLVLSTRETPALRDHLLETGITQMSAESKTTPGGYKDETSSGEQFSVADQRSLKELMLTLQQKGFDPVLKDWVEDFQGIKY